MTRDYDSWLSDDSTPTSRAWEDWWARVKVGDACEVVGPYIGTATDGDGVSRVEVGGKCNGTIEAIDGDAVTVLGDDGLRYVLDCSDVGPVSR